MTFKPFQHHHPVCVAAAVHIETLVGRVLATTVLWFESVVKPELPILTLPSAPETLNPKP